MTLVSLVVPAYNAERFLEATLESVRAQTMRNFECLVVNDGSTDATGALALDFRKRDGRFRILTHRANSGLSAARNSGLRAARGRFVAFLDADDLLMRDSLARRAQTCLDHAANPACIGTYCASVTIDETTRKPPPSGPATLPPVTFLGAAGRCPFNANQPMLAAEAARRMGGFNEALDQTEDYDFWIRILRAGYYFAPTQWRCVTYRARRDSMVRGRPMAHLARSWRIFESVRRPLPPDARPPDACGADAPQPFVKPLDAYRGQSDMLNRTFEFAGMALAQDPDGAGEIAGRIVAMTPDFDLIAPPQRDPVALIVRGLERFHVGENRPPEELERVAGDFVALLRARRAQAAESGESVSEETGADETGADETAPAPWPYPDHPEASRVWAPRAQARTRVLFLPHSAYHLWTVSMIAPRLDARGVAHAVVDLSAAFRDGGVRKAARDLGAPLIGLSEALLGNHRPAALVVFNDWDPSTRPLVAAANAAGLRTIGVVEGIQDYRDADTGQDRRAYRSVDTVLLPGAFDARYFEGSDQSVAVGGVPRIQHLRRRPRTPRPAEPVALINANFSYGVLSHERDAWLEKAVAGCRAAGLRCVISRHPADEGTLFPELVTDRSFYDALEDCAVTVQRFASGVLEALARGRPVVYFNPHGERVDKFADPMGAYVIARDVQGLAAALGDLDGLTARAEAHGDAFLDLHAGPMDLDAADAVAAAIAEAAAAAPPPEAQAAFRRYVRAIDRSTGALTDRRPPSRHARGPEARAELERLVAATRGEGAAAVVRGAGWRRGPSPVLRLRLALDRRLERFYRGFKDHRRIGPLLRRASVFYDRRLKP